MDDTFYSFRRKIFFLFIAAFLVTATTYASTGDTILVHGFNHFLHQNCNTGNSTFLFPSDTIDFYKILLRYELSCPPGIGCDIYDRKATLHLKNHTGIMDSTATPAPSFKVNGSTRDTFEYMSAASYSYSYNTITHQVDSMALSSLQLILFNDAQNPLIATDTLTVWPAYYNQYQFDSTGMAIDSVFVTPDSTLFLTYDTVYIPFEVVEPFEIARAITPYGQGVVLWFDVSDYRTLLHDSVELTTNVCGYSNGWEVTTDFYFIEGNPPLHPYKVVNLWNGTFPYGNTSNPIDGHLQPISLNVDSQSVYEKVRLITTGHGFGCLPNQNVAEFYDVTHSIIINGTTRIQHLWRDDCGRNPLYPQGAPGYTSTWFYDRANWCPGSYVKPHDYNATNLVGSSDSLIVDYNMAPYTVTSIPSGAYAPEYYIASQAIFYDDIHYTNNAALLEVRRPNGEFNYNRMNPICQTYTPEVVIRNYGSDTLRQLTLHYGIDGNFSNAYVWNGNLIFMDSLTIQLPSIPFGAGQHSFDIYIDQPNSNTDEFPYDDTLHTVFTSTNIYPTNFMVIMLRTDASPGQTSWKVRDDQGTVLFSRNSYPQATTWFYDTVYLSNGCFNLTVYDSYGDGICCYNPPGNAGVLRIFQGASATPLHNSGDYGDFFSMNFTLDFPIGIDEQAAQNSIFVYPNPATDKLTINTSFENGDLILELLDVTGRSVSDRIEKTVSGYSVSFDIPQIATGLYYLKIQHGMQVGMKKIFITEK